MIRILFDGPPSHESGRFIEVENENGESIKLGEWVQDGEYWVLQFPDCREINAELLKQLENLYELWRSQVDWQGELESINKPIEQAIAKAKGENA